MGKKTNLLIRYIVFVTGLFVASMGVAFSTKAGLGTSPVASLPYAVSLVNRVLTLGGWLNLLSIIQIIVQVILTRKNCNIPEIVIQTVLAFVYGFLTDLSCSLIKGLQVNTYASQFGYMLAGCLVLAIGIWIQYMGGVAMLPGEAMNRAISQVTGKAYESVKIFFDICYITLAAIISLSFLGRVEGVREGSVIAAVLVGLIIKMLNGIWKKIKLSLLS